MNLYILSQDKDKFLLNPPLIFIEKHLEHWHVVAYDNTVETILGEYTSEKQAREIIEDIMDYVMDNETFEGNYEQSDLFLKTMILRNMVKVYEMPKNKEK